MCVASACGSVAADFVCTPMDVVKTRLQLSKSGVLGEVYSGPIDCAITIVKNEKLRSLFKGLSPALCRACTYGTARFGFYEPFKGLIAGNEPAGQLSLGTKILAGVGSGGVASYVFSPLDLLKVRMQGDRSGKRYPRLLPAFVAIAQVEGIRGMYRGSSVNVARAATCAAVELVSYGEFKEQLVASGRWPFGDSFPTHVAASMAAGFLSTIASAPIDLLKSRLMNQPCDAAGSPKLYASPLQCLRQTVASEGFLSLYAGFWPSYLRLGPHTVMVFVVAEQVRHGMNWTA